MRQTRTLIIGFLSAMLCLSAIAEEETLRPTSEETSSFERLSPDSLPPSETNTLPSNELAPDDASSAGSQCERIELPLSEDQDQTEQIRQILAENTYSIKTMVGGILANAPSQVAVRMQILTQLGVEEASIAEQCDCLPKGLNAKDIFSGALSAGLSPNLLAQNCLEQIPPEQIPDVLIQALGQLQSSEYALFFQEVNEILTRTGLNGREVLVESLIAGEFLREEDVDAGCVGDCITPLAEALTDQLLTEDPASAPGELDSEDDEEEDEGNFSNS